MQTFLPYESFVKSAICLDRARLGKQRVEAKQLILALKNGGAWANHPAAKMWRGHEVALANYGYYVCDEWVTRGYQDTLMRFFLEHGAQSGFSYTKPFWLGNYEFHRAHRSNLLRKMPEHYSKFGWCVPNDLPYIWPISNVTKS